jgi:hypothetical protein
MPSRRVLFVAIASGALLGMTGLPAHAQTILTGAHDNNPSPPGDSDGYDAEGPGSFIVPADVGGVPSATFNNSDVGLSVDNGATITVNGGQFNNDAFGLYALNSDVTINGGVFNSGDDVYVYGHTLSISGGTFDNGYGIWAHDAAVTITGGRFSNATADFYVYSDNLSFDVYGQFDGLTTGQTEQLAVQGLPHTFTGTLQNETASQTFIYRGTGGTITLHDGALPEPTSAAILCGLSLIGLARRRRVL